jgi:hypothetical protein
VILVRLFVLWVPFALGAAAALLISLWFIASGREGYARDLTYSLDRLLAQVFGCSGRYTMSAEAYVRTGRGWRALREFLDFVDSDHCRRAAVAEGLVATTHQL